MERKRKWPSTEMQELKGPGKRWRHLVLSFMKVLMEVKMITFRASKLIFLIFQRSPCGSVGPFQSPHFQKFSSSFALTVEEPERISQEKLLKVALLGRPNVGKSTLVNKILKLNLCGASHKSHTTKTPLRAAFTKGDTQIVFVDTPGLVTQKELSRFQLPENFNQAWKKNFIQDIDIIGVVHHVNEVKDIFKYPLSLVQNVQDLPETKPLFLVINKIDLVINKTALQNAMDCVKNCASSENIDREKKPRIWQLFSKIFFTSAIKNIGVSDITNYLLEQAKPGNWLFEPGQHCDKPLNALILQLLRAQVLDILPQEIPYLCKYEIEYLKENDLGEIICVALITCRYKKHVSLITLRRKRCLKSLCKKLESDLYKILGKVFKIRVVVQAPNH